MALLSDRHAFDNMALRRAETALDSQNTPLTVEEVCNRIDYPIPVSSEDLDTLFNVCDTWGIRHNLIGENIHREWAERVGS